MRTRTRSTKNNKQSSKSHVSEERDSIFDSGVVTDSPNSSSNTSSSEDALILQSPHLMDVADEDIYIANCQKFQIPIDPNIVISLKTKWNIMMPTKSFGEGGLLPLNNILDRNDHVRSLVMTSASMWDSKYRGYGNGNSNARILNNILSTNKSIEEIDLTDTGLDDGGIIEICDALIMLMLN